MLRDQHLTKSTSKHSGVCGRLQCCLEYEHEFYCHTCRKLPFAGSKILFDGAQAKVAKIDIFKGMADLIFEDTTTRKVPLDDIRGKTGSGER